VNTFGHWFPYVVDAVLFAWLGFKSGQWHAETFRAKHDIHAAWDKRKRYDYRV
jgi:hypothetical protein